MTGPWKADLRWHDGGRLTDRVVTDHVGTALAHFRQLLRRDDLVGKPVAARFVSPITGGSVYFSRFDQTYGAGRFWPEVPLNPYVDNDQSEVIAWLSGLIASQHVEVLEDVEWYHPLGRPSVFEAFVRWTLLDGVEHILGFLHREAVKRFVFEHLGAHLDGRRVEKLAPGVRSLKTDVRSPL